MPPLRDLKGQRFGRLVVIHNTSKRGKQGGVFWLCGCDCGANKEILGASLVSGASKSCGCLSVDRGRSLDLSKDIKGQRFGKLVAIKRVSKDKWGSWVWECLCDCGGEKKAITAKLLNGRVCNCGCERSCFTKNDFLMNQAKRNSFYITDHYIKSILTSRNSLGFKDIPRGLIEAKRLQIQIKREVDR